MVRKNRVSSPLIVVVLALAFHVSSDLKALRSETSYVDYTLSDMDRVLDQNPGDDEIQSIRLRLQQILDQIRMLSIDHPAALAFFPRELDATYDLFGEVKAKYEAKGPPL